MHHAAAKGHLGVLQRLGESSIDLNLFGRKNILPLHLAARYGHTRAIEFLLKLSNTHVNAQDDNGYTPIHYASMYGALESVQLLLQHTKNESAGESESPGCSLLQLAAFYGHWEIANFLLEHGDRPEVDKSTNQMYPQSGVVPCDVVKRILEHPDFRDINCFYQPRGGLLHSAVRQADSEMLQLLLDREDVDVNVYNPWGMGTPISLAAELGRIDAVRLFLRHKDIDVNKRPLYKGTPLDIAKKKGLSEIIDLLLVHGAKEGDNFIEANAKSDHEKISTNEDQEDTSSTGDDEYGSSREPTIM
jgi:ankyrin repeat protein